MGGLLAGALAFLVTIVVDVLVDRRRIGGAHAGDSGEGFLTGPAAIEGAGRTAGGSATAEFRSDTQIQPGALAMGAPSGQGADQ